jgi:hypothetical protein
MDVRFWTGSGAFESVCKRWRLSWYVASRQLPGLPSTQGKRARLRARLSSHAPASAPRAAICMAPGAVCNAAALLSSSRVEVRCAVGGDARLHLLLMACREHVPPHSS